MIDRIKEIVDRQFKWLYKMSDEAYQDSLNMIAREIQSEYDALFKGDEGGILTKKDRELCVPTEEEIDVYLAGPDDPVAASLREALKPDDFRRIAYVLLYGEKCQKAQKLLTLSLLPRCDSKGLLSEASIKEIIENMNEPFARIRIGCIEQQALDQQKLQGAVKVER